MSEPGAYREHLGALVAQAAPVADALRAHGHRVFLVGGVVRDLLLGRSPDAPDVDLTTDARPERIVALIGAVADDVWTQGVRFGTVGCRVGLTTIEITTHRSEAYVADSRKPVVEFSDQIEIDLSRRDFTVNAMAIELPRGELVDPFEGAADLRNRVLRTPLTAQISFSDDPLRMLRAARFVAGYGLVPAPGVADAMAALRTRLAIVSRERVRDELDKLLGVTDPTEGFALLERTGLLGEFLPEVTAASLAAMASAASVNVRRAALLAGAEAGQVRARLADLRYSSADQAGTARTIELARVVGELDRVDDAVARRFVHRAQGAAADALALARALGGRAGADALAARLDSLGQREDVAALGPELDGDEVQALLGLRPGRDVGRALDYLLAVRLDEGLLGKDVAAARLKAWWSRPAGD